MSLKANIRNIIAIYILLIPFSLIYAIEKDTDQVNVSSNTDQDTNSKDQVESKKKASASSNDQSNGSKDKASSDNDSDKDTKQSQSKDYKFLQFNLMRSQNARLPYNAKDTTYLEMEFGGRSGFVDLYGYLDVFDIFNRGSDDRHDGDNMFFKIQPRFSLNDILHKDLSIGPIKEWYISTLAEVGDRELFNMYIGPGVDVDVPWFGKVGVNLYARYVRENYGAPNEDSWDGYKLATNWFKPFYTFKNGSYLSYQGYFDYTFGMDKYDDTRSSYSIEWFNGLYWHFQSFAAGFGLKYFGNMTGIKDGSAIPGGGTQDTTGWGEYFDITYVFV